VLGLDEAEVELVVDVLLRREDATDNSVSDLSPKNRVGWVVEMEEDDCCCEKVVVSLPIPLVAVDPLRADDDDAPP